MIPMPDRPGGGQAVLRGCRCDFVENRSGRGVGGLVLGIDQHGVAHRIDAPVYVVHKRCPVHAPRWVMTRVVLAGLGASVAAGNVTAYAWPGPAQFVVGPFAAVLVMLGCARWYDNRSRRARG